MADQPIQWREPELFAAGDTLKFQKYLPDYLPGDGWVLHYALTQNTQAAPQKVAEFTSTTSTSDATCHAIEVDDFGAGLEGEFILTGRVENATTGEAHTFYISELTLQPDLLAGAGAAPVLTEAQQMIALLQDTLKQLYKLKFAETEDLRSRFRIQDQTRVLADLKYWKSVRINEIQMEQARNGQTPGNVTEAYFRIG